MMLTLLPTSSAAPDEEAADAFGGEPTETKVVEDEDYVADDTEAPDGMNDYAKENAAQLDGAEYVLDELLIKFKEPWQVPGNENQLQHEIDKLDKVDFIEALGVYVVKVDGLAGDPNAILNRFKNNVYVEYVEPNYILRSCS